jgi:gas vesicle structural protein
MAPGPHAGPPRGRATAKRQAGRIIDPDDSTLLEVIDNLLSKGVVLNAEVILALADVDLVYLRLSALLCAADRVLPPRAP